ncbi:uncharacterized protein PITG_00362 [Phytophthora infestans T30-4]|uniref:Uncharacterized protein n=2 Tax=Phytophthora infestans TaxID=4787 RepID=D0MQL5_PHYIT|nr:uncharacterized protein PITG_00362 [Phytophthora infestans T30-4]EEY57784.1 conserved hypothetical protein [Phytophthora infestans T30-4]KAF4033315.1 hypothetical protein GN244_ATG14649 [Phytophthora infestans]KAF4142206.1 hypothetical protein GN958_ATG08382 [Phytophthora infestans]KAI9989559.1 hypothetical protein PInf_019844 [Phytophthora infestans]|eukprot:XP_002908970.1 conserved hypothetical protein [Phytophthora infestans T30-4]
MSGRDFHATATQLVHRQSSSQHLRQYTFAATIANRFYSDNSLDRQRRVVECARRRQARAQDRALQQAYRVEQLENELAEAERVRKLKEEREASRMERKLQHVAAAYIQYIWRRYCQLKREAVYRQTRAERVLVDFLSYRYSRRKAVRRQASFRIQRRWRGHRLETKTKLGLAVLASFFIPFIRKRRARRLLHAIKLQRWYRRQYAQRREKSARIIQRAWRTSVSRAKIRYYSRAYRHLMHLKRLEKSARVVQRTIGTRIIQHRLMYLPEFDEYPSVMAASWPPLRSYQERAVEYWRQEKQALEDAIAERKRLDNEEVALESNIESLQQRLAEAKSRGSEENERLLRHPIIEEHRRLKDEETKQKRLQELEETMRRSIRLELERELETARRLMLRSKRHHNFNVAILDDERIELT